MSPGERILFFIKQFYGSQTKFAEYINIHTSVLSRYISNKSYPGWEMLLKFHEAGMSIDWLINEEGPIFADNPRGYELRGDISESSDRTPANPYDRILGWININFGSLKNYAYVTASDYNELHCIFFGDYLPGPEFVRDLVHAGCNTEWLSTGEGNSYADNPMGRFLIISAEPDIPPSLKANTDAPKVPLVKKRIFSNGIKSMIARENNTE